MDFKHSDRQSEKLCAEAAPPQTTTAIHCYLKRNSFIQCLTSFYQMFHFEWSKSGHCRHFSSQKQICFYLPWSCMSSLHTATMRDKCGSQREKQDLSGPFHCCYTPAKAPSCDLQFVITVSGDPTLPWTSSFTMGSPVAPPGSVSAQSEDPWVFQGGKP